MGVEVFVDQSHRCTFLTPLKLAFKVTLLPTGSGAARDLHYIILVDSSGSMRGKKIKVARDGAKMLVERIPDGNYVTLIAFGVGGGDVKVLVETARVPEEREKIIKAIEKLNAEDGTPLYHALLMADRVAKKSGKPGFIVLLSDGIPTDVTDMEAYRKLGVPEGYKMVLIGIGADYNHELFAVLADMSGGDFHHVSEDEVDKLPDIMKSFAVEEAAARFVEVHFEGHTGEVRLLNYTNPVRVPALEEAVTIYGEIDVPKLYKGKVLTVRASYSDPDRDDRVELVREVSVEPAEDRDTFLKCVNRTLLDEYNYYLYMARAREALMRGDLGEATRKLREAEKLAAQTRRVSLIQSTKKLLQEVEHTRRLSGRSFEEATKKLVSEATKKLRSS